MDESLPIMEADFEQPAGDLSMLTDTEWEVLRVAVDELDATLPANRLYEACNGLMPKNAINDLANTLLDAGWVYQDGRYRVMISQLVDLVLERTDGRTKTHKSVYERR